jgi:hypothetical protein
MWGSLAHRQGFDSQLSPNPLPALICRGPANTRPPSYFTFFLFAMLLCTPATPAPCLHLYLVTFAALASLVRSYQLLSLLPASNSFHTPPYESAAQASTCPPFSTFLFAYRFSPVYLAYSAYPAYCVMRALNYGILCPAGVPVPFQQRFLGALGHTLPRRLLCLSSPHFISSLPCPNLSCLTNLQHELNHICHV